MVEDDGDEVTRTDIEPTYREQIAAAQRPTDQQVCNARHIAEVETQQFEAQHPGVRIDRFTRRIIRQTKGAQA